MDSNLKQALRGSVVDEEGELLSAGQLGRVCHASEEQVELWVIEGVLQPSAGSSRAEWRFGGAALRRMHTAERLQRDLEINESGVAVALALLDRIAALEARLRRLGDEAGGRS